MNGLVKKTKLKLVKFPDPILLTPCSEVKGFNKALHEILDEMLEVMEKNNGIGLAANQVGVSKRIFIMIDNRKKVWEFINPTITEKEGEADQLEGCLSLTGYALKCKRYQSVTVKAQDRFGEQFTVVAYDLEAVCIQHEYDHLEGIFFTSKEIK